MSNSKSRDFKPLAKNYDLWSQRPTPKKILLEPLREMDAKWLFLESLKYIYLNHSRKSQEFVWFY
jgi:hypothetical protein